jgi:hypothetical protein
MALVMLKQVQKRGCHLLSVEDIVITPVLADGECLAETAVLVSLGEQPGRVHEILPWGNSSFQYGT